MESIIVTAVFAVVVIVTIALGVRTVPQGSKQVVQRLVVTWPGGKVQVLEGVDVDRRLVVEETP